MSWITTVTAIIIIIIIFIIIVIIVSKLRLTTLYFTIIISGQTGACLITFVLDRKSTPKPTNNATKKSLLLTTIFVYACYLLPHFIFLNK